MTAAVVISTMVSLYCKFIFQSCFYIKSHIKYSPSGTYRIMCFILSLYLLTECDNCDSALLVDVEKIDNALARLKQQLKNITNGPGSLSNHLEANISDTKVQFMQVINSCVDELSFKTVCQKKKIPASVSFVLQNDVSPCSEYFSSPLSCRFWLGATAQL